MEAETPPGGVAKLLAVVDPGGGTRLAVAGVVLLCLMATADFLTGPEFESSIFYIIPVSFFAWFVGGRAGIVAAAASGALTLAVHAAFPPRAYPRIIYWNAGAWLAVYALFALLLGQLKLLYKHEHRSSRVDLLTRVLNRRGFLESLSAEASRARRYDLPVTLAYVDIDHFKQVNDRFGHAAGDRLLTVVARSMQREVRGADVVARLGGDEFALLLPHTTSDSAARVLDKLHRSLNRTMLEHGWPATFSLGAVTFPAVPESVEEMIRAADEAMYDAKASGRDRVVLRRAAA